MYWEIAETIRSRLGSTNESEPLLTALDFTAAVSAALVGSREMNAEELWRLRNNIVKANPTVCMFKSRSSLWRLYVRRVSMPKELYEPDPDLNPAELSAAGSPPPSEDEEDLTPPTPPEPSSQEEIPLTEDELLDRFRPPSQRHH